MGRKKSTVVKSEWLLNIILRNQFNLFFPQWEEEKTQRHRDGQGIF